MLTVRFWTYVRRVTSYGLFWRVFSPHTFLATIRAQLELRRARCSHTHTHYARREASGGDSVESASTSLSKGGSSSTLTVLEIGKESKLAAKDLAASTANNPDHRPTKAAMVACCRGWAVRACASQQPDEVGSFSAPASTNLDAENDQAAPRRPPELRVGAFRASAGICTGCAGGGFTAAAGCRS